ncbi:anti sigma factor C-terminal domain-containing protein [Clostridium sp. 1001275B_160808_H3]|uniref:anti sigma factor C-terminal domain-containing protein n=1 Tax=Clostridium sp. 1001275B_160808_H3 TaxID=2787110 RepID=UPI0018999207|nr:anti sigma factor C-terminal domain-containing protein [Clostridium sp. 1001275B_160808_H3]
MKNIDDFLDENKIKKAVRIAKIKLTLKIIVLSIIVFIIGSFINSKLCLKYSLMAYERDEAVVKLSTPNGYISESSDFFGILGGTRFMKISKSIGGKNVIINDSVTKFGLNGEEESEHTDRYDRINGGGPNESESEWPISTWKYGYKSLRFFHPALQYKEYQNDLNIIEKVPDGKVIEMAISFDKPYKVNDMFFIQEKLKPAKITWLWLDAFTKEKMNEYKYKIENYDSKANGIEENYVIGIECYNAVHFNFRDYNEKYDELIERLSKSPMIDHKILYDEIMERGKTSSDDAKVLGVVVHGTKEELMELINNPLIKATSFGIITDPIY